MVGFFCCLVGKDKKVCWRKGINNHFDLLKLFELPNDGTENSQDIAFVKVNVIPDSIEAIFTKDISKWIVRIAEFECPSWFTPSHKEACKQVIVKEVFPLVYLEYGGSLVLAGYKQPLPNTFTHCGGSLVLAGYKQPLPNTFTHCGGRLSLLAYDHPLPDTFTYCGGSLDLSGYKFPLPNAFVRYGGRLDLSGYYCSLPDKFKMAYYS